MKRIEKEEFVVLLCAASLESVVSCLCPPPPFFFVIRVLLGGQDNFCGHQHSVDSVEMWGIDVGKDEDVSLFRTELLSERDAFFVFGVCLVWGVFVPCVVQLLQLAFGAVVFCYASVFLSW